MGVTAVNTERGDLDKVLAGVKTVIDAAREVRRIDGC
jgi:hypothetical protein